MTLSSNIICGSIILPGGYKQTQINTIKSSVWTFNLATTGQTYSRDLGFGDTTNFQASNLCCNYLYGSNTNPQTGTDIGTQLGNMNTLLYNLQIKTIDLTHSGTTSFFNETVSWISTCWWYSNTN